MNSVRSITYHRVKFQYNHTFRTKRKVGFYDQKIYDQLYYMRQFLQPMMTDIKSHVI